MPNWSRRERTEKHIEFTVPVWADRGAAVGEVYRALAAAEKEAQALGKRTDNDEWAWIGWDDENVVIRVHATTMVEAER